MERIERIAELLEQLDERGVGRAQLISDVYRAAPPGMRIPVNAHDSVQRILARQPVQSWQLEFFENGVRAILAAMLPDIPPELPPTLVEESVNGVALSTQILAAYMKRDDSAMLQALAELEECGL